MKVRSTLEQHFKDMQDLEFTVEDNRLYILQTRNGKRTGHAAVRIAVDMVGEKLITKKDAVRRIPADSLSHLFAPVFDREAGETRRKLGPVWLPARAQRAVTSSSARKKLSRVRIEEKRSCSPASKRHRKICAA